MFLNFYMKKIEISYFKNRENDEKKLSTIEQLKYKWIETTKFCFFQKKYIFIFHSNQIFIVFNIKILLIDLFFNLFLEILRICFFSLPFFFY